MSGRSGQYIQQLSGELAYRAFVPTALPPDPPVRIDDELILLNSRADRMLAKLDAAVDLIPSPDLFLLMYAKREAVLSSQIEGTQSSLDDILRVEASLTSTSRDADLQETMNYTVAMNYGMKRLDTLPVSLRLIRELHEKLMSGTRGDDKTPGEFRRSQNWIGAHGSTIAHATFVPPPVTDLMRVLGDLEKYIHARGTALPLVKSALIHAQFETIHPFLDGNGRVGRLLLAFLLIEEGILKRPLLYPSYYLKQHRATYYERLQAVRDHGDWEGWVKFFLRAMAAAAEDAYLRTNVIIRIREAHRSLVQSALGGQAGGPLRILDVLYRHPYVQTQQVTALTSVTFPTAARHLAHLERLGLVREVTGRKRDRVFAYDEYLEALRRDSFVDERTD